MPKVLLVHFDFDGKKFTPTPEMDRSIAEFKSWIEKYPASVIQVTGHTDFIGTPDYNLDLALERALAVKQYLAEKGLPPDRIETLSKGEEQPVADLFTSEGRRLNRRTEISIKK
jgi:outer membrane protein OmpA-like peptidoglycan-associated protein